MTPITSRPAGTDPRTSMPSTLTSGDGERFLAELPVPLEHLDDRYGGIEAYLPHAAGVERDVLARLRDRLVATTGP